MIRIRQNRWARLGGVLLVAGGLSTVVGVAGPAGAQTFKGVTCHAHVTDTAGDVLDLDIPQDLGAAASAPATASAGAVFTVAILAGGTTLPTVSNGLTVSSYTALSTTYKVTGASIVAGSVAAPDSPTINGKKTKGTAKIVGNTVITGIPGPIPPGKLTTPKVTFKVKAGGAGSNVVVNVTEADTTAHLALGAIPGQAAVKCPFPANTLATTGVTVAGAPNAVDDAAGTAPGKAVTVNVLANDGANSSGAAPDPSTLEVTANPGHGTATVSSGKVVYTPAAGFTGTDTFKYQVCDAIANPTTTTTTTTLQPEAARKAVVAPEGTTLKCDAATVTVSVAAVVVQATTTTVAVLPRTGSSSTPLALVGGGMCVLGLALVTAIRRRPRVL